MFPERFLSDTIDIELKSGEIVEFPLIFWRNYKLAIRFMDGFFIKYGILNPKTNTWNDEAYHSKFNNYKKSEDDGYLDNFNGEFYNDWLLRFNCHFLTLRLLGLNIPLKFLRPIAISFDLKLFKDSEFKTIKNFKEMEDVIKEKFKTMQTNILISQTVSKDNDLLHSMCFILKGEEIIYISKHGGVGEIYHSPLENMFVHYFSTKSKMPYGNKFAFGDWLSLYSDPELHLIFSDFTERLEIRYNEHIAQAELK